MQQGMSLEQLVEIVLNRRLRQLELVNRWILLWKHQLLLHQQNDEHHQNLGQQRLLVNKSTRQILRSIVLHRLKNSPNVCLEQHH